VSREAVPVFDDADFFEDVFLVPTDLLVATAPGTFRCNDPEDVPLWAGAASVFKVEVVVVVAVVGAGCDTPFGSSLPRELPPPPAASLRLIFGLEDELAVDVVAVAAVAEGG